MVLHPMDPHDPLMSLILPLKWNYVKNFPYGKTFQSVLPLCFENISPVSNTAKLHLLLSETVWSERTDLKRGKETRFQPEFIFRKTPAVEVKQTKK